VTDMFLSAAPSLDEENVQIYDEVLNLLVNRSDQPAIVKVSRRMAPVANAPRQLVRRLANDTNIDVAGPVLARSPRLTTEDLREIAVSRGNAHLLAISGRNDLVEPVTDVLVTRGDRDVARAVANNQAAKLSAQGVERLLERAEEDETVGQRVRARGDIPQDILNSAIAKVAARTAERSRKANAAQKLMLDLKQSGGLDDARIVALAAEKKYDEVVAALALLSGLKFDAVENMMYPQRIGGVVVVCKATGLVLTTLIAILRLSMARNGLTETEMKQAHREYLSVSRGAADRIIRFWHVRQTVDATKPD